MRGRRRRRRARSVPDRPTTGREVGVAASAEGTGAPSGAHAANTNTGVPGRSAASGGRRSVRLRNGGEPPRADTGCGGSAGNRMMGGRAEGRPVRPSRRTANAGPRVAVLPAPLPAPAPRERLGRPSLRPWPFRCPNLPTRRPLDLPVHPYSAPRTLPPVPERSVGLSSELHPRPLIAPRSPRSGAGGAPRLLEPTFGGSGPWPTDAARDALPDGGADASFARRSRAWPQ